MTLYEFCERYNISLAKGRKIAKENSDWFGEAGSAVDALRAYLAKGVGITTMQLVGLIENPSWLLSLGKYAEKAEQAIAALGNCEREAAPKEVVANIMEAAKGEPEAVQILVDWLRSIVPAKPVSHSYVAVRLSLGIPASIRRFEIPRIPRAMLNCRRHPDFNGWWRVVKTPARTKTLYQRPNKLFDL